MDQGFYFLMCNYGKPGTSNKLHFEALLQFTDKQIKRYTLGDTVEEATRIYFLYPNLEQQIIERETGTNEDLLFFYICNHSPDPSFPRYLCW